MVVSKKLAEPFGTARTEQSSSCSGETLAPISEGSD